MPRGAPANRRNRLLGFFRRKTGPSAGAGVETADLQRKAASIEANIEELAPQINAAKQRLEFLTEEYRNRLGDFLNEPSNARRLIRQPRACERRRAAGRNARANARRMGPAPRRARTSRSRSGRV